MMSSLVRSSFPRTLPLIQRQTSSIGLRSGLFAGHFMTLILRLARYLAAAEPAWPRCCDELRWRSHDSSQAGSERPFSENPKFFFSKISQKDPTRPRGRGTGYVNGLHQFRGLSKLILFPGSPGGVLNLTPYQFFLPPPCTEISCRRHRRQRASGLCWQWPLLHR